jgi:hypothetical protein
MFKARAGKGRGGSVVKRRSPRKKIAMSDNDTVEKPGDSQPKKARGDYAEKWGHIKHTYLILVEEHFIVFLDEAGDIDWETSLEYDAKGHKDTHKHNAIINDAALLETTPCDGVRADRKRHFKRLIGEAIARSLDDDYASAETMLAAAGKYISARTLETSRFWYLSASVVATVPFVLFGCALWRWRAEFIQVLGFTVFWLAMSAVAGALGALLSVTTRAGELKFDTSAGRTLHYLEAASRIGTGVLSGVVVALAVHTEVILAPLSRGNKMPAIMVLAAFAGGAAERLATSIISKFSPADTKVAHNESRPAAKELTDE